MRILNKYFFRGDTLVLLNNTDGTEIYYTPKPGTVDLSVEILKYTWYIKVRRTGLVASVQANVYINGQRAMVWLHEFIMRDVPHKPDQIEIDHIDGNPLNNRWDNLRWVTRTVNSQNKRDVNRKPMSGRRLRDRSECRTRPWQARIGIGNGTRWGKRMTKYFSTAREAEEQVLIWKRQYHPETPEIWYEEYRACQASGYFYTQDAAKGFPTPSTLFEESV